MLTLGPDEYNYILMYRPTSFKIEQLVRESKSLAKKGVYRSEEQSMTENHIAKMTRLLREYEVENKLLNKKI